MGQQKLFLLFNCKLVSSDRPLPISPSHTLFPITINQHSMSKFNELTQTTLNILSEAVLYLPLGAWFITFNNIIQFHSFDRKWNISSFVLRVFHCAHIPHFCSSVDRHCGKAVQEWSHARILIASDKAR